MEDSKLVTESQDLQVEGGTAAEGQRKGREER